MKLGQDIGDNTEAGTNLGRAGQVWSVNEYPGDIGSDYGITYDYNPAGALLN